MTEEWRDIPGYEDMYQVSDLGRVRSLDRVVPQKNGPRKCKGRILKPAVNTTGYYHVMLGRGGSHRGSRNSHLVHALVVLAFIGPRPEGHDVRHGELGKLNNSASNLSYGTRTENNNDRWRDGTMTHRQVVREDGQVYRSLTATKEDGFNPSGVCLACQGKYKMSGGFAWRYA
jgi:hypothetical protein